MDFDFVAFDGIRMFIWEGDLFFLLEIVIRVVIVYIYAILLLRILGNSWMKDMNFLDYFMVISLGTASWDVMIYPTVPILYSLVAITAAILLKKLISILNFKSELVNNAIQATPSRLILDGAIDFSMLKINNLRKDTFFTMLRINWIIHTWQVKKCYLELNWALSIFKIDDDENLLDGESTIPPEEIKN